MAGRNRVIRMDRNQSSRTAEYMAFFRATESVRSEEKRLFRDPFAACFLRTGLRRAVSLSRVPLLAMLVDWYADRRLPGARTSAVARTKFIDDALLRALQESVPQVVILGAGFDCRGYRLRELQKVAVFEVDHPDTLAVKRALIRKVLPQLPENVHLVEMDFNRQSLPVELPRVGFDSAQATVFIWEGVTNYLTVRSVDSVLRYVGSCAKGTQLIFTYVDAGLLDGSVDFDGAERLLNDVRSIGEPWTFGLHPGEVAEFLALRGLRLEGDFSACEYRAKYFGAGAQRMRGYDFYHVATAHGHE